MKILVFDDNELHCEAARLTLKDHDVTIVGTYDEAQKVLCPRPDFDRRMRLMNQFVREAGLPEKFSPGNNGVTKGQRRLYYNAERRVKKQLVQESVPNFDVVMTDLMVLPSGQAQADKLRFANEEMPLGCTIALLALRRGVKNVAVVTDMNHHKHPASAAFDCFGNYGSVAQGIKVVCTNRVEYVILDVKTREIVDQDFMGSDAGKAKYPVLDYRVHKYPHREGLFAGKNWGQVLQQLLAPPEDFEEIGPQPDDDEVFVPERRSASLL